MVARACNPGIQEVEAGGPAVYSHPQLHSKLEISLEFELHETLAQTPPPPGKA